MHKPTKADSDVIAFALHQAKAVDRVADSIQNGPGWQTDPDRDRLVARWRAQRDALNDFADAILHGDHKAHAKQTRNAS